tara:strand:- start:153 stop:365 length:213 start_codon:yes stop_codon:yes gene_type:complete
MATYIVKYTAIQDRVVIVEADSEENAKLIGDDGNTVGNIVINEYSENSDETGNSTKITVTAIDEITYRNV